MLHQAIALLEATMQRLAEIEARFGSLEAKLAPTEPETAYQVEAAKLLGCSDRTLNRWRNDIPLVAGIHWWMDGHSSRPIYNLRLIRDGQRQGFDSPAHRRACEQWLKQQPSNLKKRA
jgi:hypothetical protein